MSDVPIDPIGAARRLDTILGRADLPYTYTEPNGDSLRMCSDGPDLVVTVRQDGGARTVVVPREETPNLARAVAAAGDTGHLVVSTEENDAVRARGFELTSEVRQLLQQRKDLRRERDAAFEDGARSMRERAAQEVVFETHRVPMAISEAISALPLLPDGAEVAHSGCSQERSETPSEQPAVHVATPEGITPCGAGHHDVTTAALIAEVTCVGCLQALALEKGGQVVEMRNERDRLRTAWESARRGRAEARETAGMERFFAGVAAADVIRLRKELRAETGRVSQARDERDQALQAARSTRDRIAEWLEECGSAWEGAHVRAMTLLPASSDQTGDALPAEDLVEPGDEVTDLAELHELVERLALDLSETGKAVTKRLAVVEGRLGITDEDTTDEAPTRYRDRDGDLWEQDADNPDRYILTQWRDGSSVGHPLTRTLDALRDGYGPLTPVTT